MKKIALFLIPFLSLASGSFAYEATEVRNGGSIEGVVLFEGASVPKDETLTLSSESGHCGKSLPARKYLIRDRKIENVIVSISGIKAGKAVPGAAVTVTNLKCEFVPHVAVGFKGNKIIMKNDDPMLHTFDLHASLDGKHLYSVSLHEKGSTVTKTLTKSGLLELSCYAHPWQQSYVSVFDHPYAVVTNEKGEFSLQDVPPGTYTVEAWHEALGRVAATDVKVESGKASKLKLAYSRNINLH